MLGRDSLGPGPATFNGKTKCSVKRTWGWGLMSETVLETKPVNAPSEDGKDAKPVVIHADERIAFRGPIQRVLVSPEIGAIIGAVLVWAFFWGNGAKFGTPGTTLIMLDSAAPLGIMAVVVALLMIGGEFDLSAGMMTGATGIMVGLMVKYFHGSGGPMWLAVGAAFILAGAIGFFNGTLVNRTGLPSFIVTLATFFILKGVVLVLAKRLEHKVQVSDVKDKSGFKGFASFFAREFKPERFTGRDVAFTLLGMGAVALGAAGLCEQSFIRRAAGSARAGASRVIIGIAGVVVAVLAFVMLQRTDSVGANVLWGVVGAIGVIFAIVGLAMARYVASERPAASRPGLVAHRDLRAFTAAGVGAVAIACLAPLVLDRDERLPILTWFPTWLRPTIAAVAALTGVAIAFRQLWPRLRERFAWYRPIQAVAFVAIAGLLLMVALLSVLQLMTVQALRAVVMMTMSGVGLGLLMVARGRAAKVDRRAQSEIGALAVISIVVLAFVIRGDSDVSRFRSGLFTAMLTIATLLFANTVLEAMLRKRREADVKADRLGRRLLVAAFVCTGAAILVRVVFTNIDGQSEGGAGSNIARMSIVWWLLATVIGAFVLTKTKWGNWIFAVGGNKEAARAIGVPANRVKVALFVTVSLVGCFVGVMVLARFGSVQASQGDGLEFFYIIAAVVGGNLLTGGYGSVVGASVGALILTMSDSGIAAAGWNQDGKFAVKGVVLIVAVLVNNVVRKKAQEAR